MSKQTLRRGKVSLNAILSKVTSWDDYFRAAQALKGKGSTSLKGKLFERLTQIFFQHHPDYAFQTRNVWLFAEIPASIKKDLNLSPGTKVEKGTDLLIRTRSNEFWLVQAKFLADVSGCYPTGKLGTFGTQSAAFTRGISRGILCTTKVEKNPEFESAASFRFQQLTLERWQSLDSEFWAVVRRAARKQNIARPKPFKYRRPWQSDALNAARKHFVKEGRKRGKLVMPCGMGKSLIGYWTAVRVLKADSVLVVVPTLDLVRQTFSTWARESWACGLKLNAAIVCSDRTTGRLSDEDEDANDISASDMQVNVWTDPREIKKWLREKGKAKELKVVFCTYKSGETLASATGRNCFFDVAIFDEAHKTAGYQGKMNQHLLYQRNIKIEKRIFMTATERFYSGGADEVVGMNDERIYGKRYHYLSFAKAIEGGVLADYTPLYMFIRGKDVEKYRELIEGARYVRLSTAEERAGPREPMTADDLATAIAIRKAMQKYKLSHAVSFHAQNIYAQDFVETQNVLNKEPGLGSKIRAFRVSGDMNARLRALRLREFEKSKKGLVANARCLTEGVDVPNIDLVVFAQPRQSKVDIVQAIGRALRLPATRQDKHAYVLIPGVVEDGKEKDWADTAGYQNLISIVKALSTVDENVVERIQVSLAGRTPRSRRITSTGSRGVSEALPIGLNLEEFRAALRVEVGRKIHDFFTYAEAHEFIRTLPFALDNAKDYRRYMNHKHPSGVSPFRKLPANPDTYYKRRGTWVSWPHFLGTARWSRKVSWLPFEEARDFVRRLELQTQQEWSAWSAGRLPGRPARPRNIPSNPSQEYEGKGWINFPDWIGRERRKIPTADVWSFERARAFVYKLKLKNPTQWAAWVRGDLPNKPERPKLLPSKPKPHYEKSGDWISWPDWLGTRPGWRKIEKLPYKEARKVVRRLKLRSQADYQAWSKTSSRPENIPANPYGKYKQTGEWAGWNDFLGLPPRYSQFTPAQKKAAIARIRSGKSTAPDEARKLGLSKHTVYKWLREQP